MWGWVDSCAHPYVLNGYVRARWIFIHIQQGADSSTKLKLRSVTIAQDFIVSCVAQCIFRYNSAEDVRYLSKQQSRAHFWSFIKQGFFTASTSSLSPVVEPSLRCGLAVSGRVFINITRCYTCYVKFVFGCRALPNKYLFMLFKII